MHIFLTACPFVSPCFIICMFFCRCRRVWQKHHCKADEDSSCRRLQCWVSYKCIPMPGFCPSLVGSKISGFKCWYVLLSWTCGVKDVGLKSRICEGVVNRFSETQTYLVLISSISPRFILSKKSHTWQVCWKTWTLVLAAWSWSLVI